MGAGEGVVSAAGGPEGAGTIGRVGCSGGEPGNVGSGISADSVWETVIPLLPGCTVYDDMLSRLVINGYRKGVEP